MVHAWFPLAVVAVLVNALTDWYNLYRQPSIWIILVPGDLVLLACIIRCYLVAIAGIQHAVEAFPCLIAEIPWLAAETGSVTLRLLLLLVDFGQRVITALAGMSLTGLTDFAMPCIAALCQATLAGSWFLARHGYSIWRSVVGETITVIGPYLIALFCLLVLMIGLEVVFPSQPPRQALTTAIAGPAAAPEPAIPLSHRSAMAQRVEAINQLFGRQRTAKAQSHSRDSRSGNPPRQIRSGETTTPKDTFKAQIYIYGLEGNTLTKKRKQSISYNGGLDKDVVGRQRCSSDHGNDTARQDLELKKKANSDTKKPRRFSGLRLRAYVPRQPTTAEYLEADRDAEAMPGNDDPPRHTTEDGTGSLACATGVVKKDPELCLNKDEPSTSTLPDSKTSCGEREEETQEECRKAEVPRLDRPCLSEEPPAEDPAPSSTVIPSSPTSSTQAPAGIRMDTTPLLEEPTTASPTSSPEVVSRGRGPQTNGTVALPNSDQEDATESDSFSEEGGRGGISLHDDEHDESPERIIYQDRKRIIDTGAPVNESHSEQRDLGVIRKKKTRDARQQDLAPLDAPPSAEVPERDVNIGQTTLSSGRGLVSNFEGGRSGMIDRYPAEKEQISSTKAQPSNGVRSYISGLHYATLATPRTHSVANIEAHLETLPTKGKGNLVKKEPSGSLLEERFGSSRSAPSPPPHMEQT
ncbi:unnamed protein product [Zymoseptoria tritici ST99CH_1E4]|uniref:Uncharacterized protein n=1 Tax=Zymoseptoria tritici ST99CH_1E4 TaxID=1276532 RepID=A0A2H1GAR4_ZYMTR|nr:unnamed protein product [Zymoseptoria tritici ST99CH_1E4]